MKWISYRFVHTWENSPERGIQSASEWRKHRHFSDDSSERLWLVIAVISSTELCMIVYNAQCCKNASVSGSVPASEHRFEFSSWWWRTECSNHAGVIVLNIENINRLFFVFWKLHSNSLGSKFWGGTCPLTLNGHDASGPNANDHNNTINCTACIGNIPWKVICWDSWHF